MNVKGRELLDMISDIGGYILNGTARGDAAGEYTYVGPRGCSVIDYVIVNKHCQDFIQSFKIGERVDSDHMHLRAVWREAGRRGAGVVQRRIKREKRSENLLE